MTLLSQHLHIVTKSTELHIVTESHDKHYDTSILLTQDVAYRLSLF